MNIEPFEMRSSLTGIRIRLVEAVDFVSGHTRSAESRLCMLLARHIVPEEDFLNAFGIVTSTRMPARGFDEQRTRVAETAKSAVKSEVCSTHCSTRPGSSIDSTTW
jgi:hypothetical protein